MECIIVISFSNCPKETLIEKRVLERNEVVKYCKRGEIAPNFSWQADFRIFLSVTACSTHRSILLTDVIKNTCFQVVCFLLNSFADLGQMVWKNRSEADINYMENKCLFSVLVNARFESSLLLVSQMLVNEKGSNISYPALTTVMFPFSKKN